MNEGKIKEALDGKLELDELNDEELSTFRTQARELAEKERNEVTGFREAKRAETEKVEKLRKEAEDLEESRKKTEADLNKGKQEVSQFRSEQIEKAKTKFFEQFPDAKEKEEEIIEKFGRLDSGKIDAEFILNDFVSAYAATDPQKYIESVKKATNLEKGASDLNRSSSGSHSANPDGSKEGAKYSEDAKKLAQAADISEEAAQKIEDYGMSRKYE